VNASRWQKGSDELNFGIDMHHAKLGIDRCFRPKSTVRLRQPTPPTATLGNLFFSFPFSIIVVLCDKRFHFAWNLLCKKYFRPHAQKLDTIQ